MDLDPLLLSRLQFAFTVSFHIIFPAFTIGLAGFVATLLVLWVRTRREHFLRLARMWTKILAVAFAMGVVSGIVLSYEFGTNWSNFSTVVGNVVGPLIGYEVLTAFFLEATFLGVLLFGWNRVPPWVHATAAVMIAIGTSMSAFWILSANSWMQTPGGYEMIAGIAYPKSWFEIIFNASFPYRFAHMFTAAYLTTSLVVLATGARYRVEGSHDAESRTMLRMGLGMVALLAPLQLVIGDQHGLNTAKLQPVKVAAMEAHWDGTKPAPLVVFAIADPAAEQNRYEIAIPNLASLIITHDPDGTFPGLKQFKPEDRPPIMPVFIGFRLMVGIGMLMIAIGLVGAFLWWRGRLFTSMGYLRLVQHGWPLGFVAILAGWWVTETGRQPWIVTGVLRTANAASPVAAGAIATSLAFFVIVYSVVFSIGIMYVYRLILKGPPSTVDAQAREDPGSVANRPLAAASPGAS